MNKIREAIALLEGIEDDLPRLDQDELESRISDLVSDVENLQGASLSEVNDGLDNLRQSLNDLYNEV